MQKFLFLLLLGSLHTGITVKAQTDYDNVPEVTEKLFINDVYLQQFSPDTFLIHDILIDKGLIIEIARELERPSNARLIEADSSYAYPCFIDAFSHTGIPKPERSRDRPDVEFPGFPPNDVAGITPEKKASSDIKVDDKSIKELRQYGFAVSHTVPRGQMLPGQGCIISLNGGSTEEMILKESSSLLFQLEGARGVYPSTVIAVMAKWRELLRQAGYYQLNNRIYKSDPSGKQRVKADAVLDALVPVVDKSQTVYSHAKSAKDVYRSLVLQKDMEYNMVLSNVKIVDPALNELKADRLKLILSADLPKTIKEEKDKNSEEEPDARIEDLKKRKQEAITEYESQAYKLEKSGVPFAFSMMDVKASNLKGNINRMIKAGLSNEGALAALTIDAAELLNIDANCGRIENGYMANIFISTEPYFNKGSSIKYSIVEGQIEEYEIKTKSDSKGKIDESLLGKWSYGVEVMGELNTGIIQISKEDEEMEVLIIDDSLPDDPRTCSEVSYKDNTLNLALTITTDEGEMQVSLSLEIDGENYSGTATIGELGSFPIEGSKISSPEK